MWCATCKAEVAGEVSHDTRSIACANCGTQVSTGRTGQASGRTRQARELLERWSTERFLDPYGPVTSPRGSGRSSESEVAGGALPFEGTLTTAGPSSEPAPAEAAPSAEPQDQSRQPATAHSVSAEARAIAEMLEQSQPGSATNETQVETSGTPVTESDPTVESRPTSPVSIQGGSGLKTESHAQPVSYRNSTEFDLEDAAREASESQASWVGVAGQFLAYGGVAVLTVGTVLVLWGHFGGPDVYAPTGWLITTAGQMLLFLGVVTLISGGLESTTREVTRRIDALARQLRRIEQATTADAGRRHESDSDQHSPATIPYPIQQPATSHDRHRDAA